MYTYRNKKTGSFFTSPCVCAGEDWEEVTVSAPKAPTPKKQTGKKQEPAANAEASDSGGENS